MNPDAIVEFAIDLLTSYRNGTAIVYGGRTWPAADVKLIVEAKDLWFVRARLTDSGLTTFAALETARQDGPSPLALCLCGFEGTHMSDRIEAASRRLAHALRAGEDTAAFRRPIVQLEAADRSALECETEASFGPWSRAASTAWRSTSPATSSRCSTGPRSGNPGGGCCKKATLQI